MLEFAHRPPRGPEDITLSESGQIVLERAHNQTDDNWDVLNGIGHVLFSQIFDAYGGAHKMPRKDNRFYLPELSEAIVEAARLLNNRELHALTNGTNNMRLELSHRYLESEVPA